MKMSELGLVEYFSMAEALGIIATMFIVLYFSRKQTHSLKVDIETKILNDLDDKIHGFTQMGIERPELVEVVGKIPSNYSAPQVAFAFHILYTFAHVFHMRQRNVLSDNEWKGWLLWMKGTFERGKIKEYWENVELVKWFDPAFEEFINKELIPAVTKK
jgi:hypothetical protein